jgi:hypothetical protein
MRGLTQAQPNPLRHAFRQGSLPSYRIPIGWTCVRLSAGKKRVKSFQPRKVEGSSAYLQVPPSYTIHPSHNSSSL